MADEITLKWGTLKAWKLETPRALELLKQWASLGSKASAMLHHDTPKQKDLLCQIIDASDVETVYLDWDGREVSKSEAKDYIRNYGREQ